MDSKQKIMSNIPTLQLNRTYKTFCIMCKNITSVFNTERKGGICWECKVVYSASIIKKWYRKIQQKKNT